MIRKVLKSLFGKIALIFLVEIMVLSAIQMYLSLTCTFDYYFEKDQKIHAETAANLAKIVEQQWRNGQSFSEIQQTIQGLRLLNPNAHIFLLDEKGQILDNWSDHSPLQRQKIDLQPVLRFLSMKPQNLKEAIFVDDPLHPQNRVIFSASPVVLPQQMGYLLVTFNVPFNSISFQSIKESGVLQNTSLAAMLTVLMSLLAGFLVFFFLNRRLQIMRNVVNYFKNGQYDARIPITAQDEIGDLGIAFNNMANEFQKYLRNLERNDRLRRELIANISHDLRSPLASARGYVETIIMKEKQLSAKERQKFLQVIYKNVVQLNDLVNELFELAKFDAQQIEPAVEAFSLAELAQDIVLKFQPQAEAQGLNLLSRFPKKLPLVKGDIGMIERAISNLIQNAIKFCDSGATVVLELKPVAHGVEICVKDNGAGIPPEDLPFIFERFYRVDKSRNRTSGGSGLGLAIVKKIVEAHGSTIQVKSVPQQETIFKFELPYWQKSGTKAAQFPQAKSKLS